MQRQGCFPFQVQDVITSGEGEVNNLGLIQTEWEWNIKAVVQKFKVLPTEQGALLFCSLTLNDISDTQLKDMGISLINYNDI